MTKIVSSRKWLTVLLHVAAWTLFFSLPYLLTSAYSNPKSRPEDNPVNDNHRLIFSIAMDITWMLFFYINANFIIPRLLYKQKYLKLAVVELLVLTYIVLQSALLFNLLMSPQQFGWGKHVMFNLFAFLLIGSASTAYEMTRDRLRADKLIKDKENENLKTELSLLRSQVSPHFMFNVLNNMVALARKKSDLLEPSLIKLSSLMRYMLYETNDEKVSLEKEIDYLNSYIDLQMQRFGKNVTIKTCFKNIDAAYQIEPMLLIPFVENAFKHGTGLIENAQIDIEMTIKNDMLHFSVRNKYNEHADEVKDKTSGIGLTNVQRRLNLLYGDNHSLLINRKDNWFTVSLQLNLH
ncbi:MAG: histidine kinase [Ginsengibacter sp.]